MFSRKLGVTSVLSAAIAAFGGAETALEREPLQERSLVAVATVDHLDVDAREPMLVQHPDGTMFVSGYGRDLPTTEQPPRLWKSIDGGGSWERVDVGTVADGAKGNSDVDLTVGGDGAIYFITMGFDRTVGEGTHVAVGASHDVGATWTWSYLTHDRRVDRPWGRETPAGSLHVIWNDGRGVSHSVSTNAGRSWQQRPKIHPQGGSSHMAVGPAGELAVRITPTSASGQQFDEGVELIAVSSDDGGSWRKHAPPGNRAWAPGIVNPRSVSRWVEPITWDDDGALYYLWSEGRVLQLGRSSDRGESWRSWTITADDEVMFFPYLVAGGAGKLAATWFSGAGDDLSVNVALIEIDANADAAPRVTLASPFAPEAWVVTDVGRTREPAGEYVPVAFLSDGDLGVVTPIQNRADGRGGFTFRRMSVR